MREASFFIRSRHPDSSARTCILTYRNRRRRRSSSLFPGSGVSACIRLTGDSTDTFCPGFGTLLKLMKQCMAFRGIGKEMNICNDQRQSDAS